MRVDLTPASSMAGVDGVDARPYAVGCPATAVARCRPPPTAAARGSAGVLVEQLAQERRAGSEHADHHERVRRSARRRPRGMPVDPVDDPQPVRQGPLMSMPGIANRPRSLSFACSTGRLRRARRDPRGSRRVRSRRARRLRSRPTARRPGSTSALGASHLLHAHHRATARAAMVVVVERCGDLVHRDHPSDVRAESLPAVTSSRSAACTSLTDHGGNMLRPKRRKSSGISL